MAIELTEKQIQDGWQVVKFGEIAKNISQRVEPSETDLKVYVGLEHLDPQSLKITRRGVPSDVTGQKLRVKPGQIIFGKRRAYQKKVAVADFDGICSAHAMVLEAIPGKIIPELLPFLMQSDMFMDRAVAISEGSLSPTIKWKTLAIQEFPLPPKERQKEILEVLEKVEDVNYKNEEVIKSLTTLLGNFKAKLAKGTAFQKDDDRTVSKVKLSELCSINYGKSPSEIMSKGDKFSVIGTGGVTGKTDSFNCEEPAVVLGRKGTIDKPQLLTEPFWAIDTTFYCLANSKTTIKWLYWFLSSIDLTKYNEASGVPSLSRNTLYTIKVPLPNLDEQNRQYKILDELSENIALRLRHKAHLNSKRLQLIQEMLLGGAA